ncbi:type III pantothenate kinase [soil metagenome]
MSRLLIDIGNSRVKFGLADIDAGAVRWLRQWAGFVETIEASDAELDAVDGVMLCSVADAATTARLEVAVRSRLPGVSMGRFVSSAAAAGIVNGYADPCRLGADRFAAAIGARVRVASGDVIIASLGTATTIDLLGADDRFKGGVILPGPALMARSLEQGTAHLPAIDWAAPVQERWPRSTAEAIADGIVQAQLGAIDRLCARSRDAALLLSGGAARSFALRIDRPHRVVDNLVLDGLARVVQTDLS